MHCSSVVFMPPPAYTGEGSDMQSGGDVCDSAKLGAAPPTSNTPGNTIPKKFYPMLDATKTPLSPNRTASG